MTNPDGKVNIALSQVVSAVFIIAIFYLVPAAYINYLDLSADNVVPYTAEALARRGNGTSNTIEAERSGRVAGAVDYAVSDSLDLAVYGIDLNSQDGMLFLAGGILLIVGGLLVIYVMLGSSKPKEYRMPEFDNSQFESAGLSKWQ